MAFNHSCVFLKKPTEEKYTEELTDNPVLPEQPKETVNAQSLQGRLIVQKDPCLEEFQFCPVFMCSWL